MVMVIVSVMDNGDRNGNGNFSCFGNCTCNCNGICNCDMSFVHVKLEIQNSWIN